MQYYEVAPTTIIRKDSNTFTYAHAETLSPGTVVLIEVGKKKLSGVIIKTTKKPHYETKQITEVIHAIPIPSPLLATAYWLSEYYATPLAQTLQTILPRGVQKKRRERSEVAHALVRDRTHFLLNEAQTFALEQIDNASSGSLLLHGVTGSGKTRIYIEAAKKTIEANKSVIILVPEIALTRQLVDEFSQHFPDVIITHSKHTEAKRHTAWLDALNADTPIVVIGPRSALFLPVKTIGLIVIDEAHEPSFKQEQSPRYSALRAASTLARLHAAKLILGSATPSVTDYYLAEHSDRPIITLSKPADSTAIPPSITLVDMTKRVNFKQHYFLSDALVDTLKTTLESGEQALIFHNRRGSTTVTLCENCGWQAGCPRCFVPLTLHSDQHQLRCHLCGFHDNVPTSCPNCGGADIIHKGIGTKRIETELKKLFPNKIIVRFDGDSDSNATVEQKYKELYDGSIDIIIGTQTIAKGLDLPHLRTVGVVQADSGLSLPDFGASERTFQLLAQVVGRVGRSGHKTNVIVQSYQPTHPAIVTGIMQDYTSFYRAALKERRRASFPPYTFLLKLTCIYKTERSAIENAQKLAKILKDIKQSDVTILGPTPAFYERQRDTYRWQIIVKSPRRKDLIELLTHVPSAHWQYELDPHSLI